MSSCQCIECRLYMDQQKSQNEIFSVDQVQLLLKIVDLFVINNFSKAIKFAQKGMIYNNIDSYILNNKILAVDEFGNPSRLFFGYDYRYLCTLALKRMQDFLIQKGYRLENISDRSKSSLIFLKFSKMFI